MLQKELKEAGLAHFQKGQAENINPDLSIDEQADLLPYDKKWEFPVENLCIGNCDLRNIERKSIINCYRKTIGIRSIRCCKKGNSEEYYSWRR